MGPKKVNAYSYFSLSWLCISACNSALLHKSDKNDGTAATTPAAELRGDPGACKLTTASQWQDFVGRNASETRWVDTCEDSQCDAVFYDFVNQNVQKVFADCAPLLQQNPGIAACTHNLQRFTPAWMRQHDATSYGFVPDNHTYLTAQTASDMPPGMMTVPAEIVAALPKRTDVEEAARINGWKYLTHDSALGNTRTFIYQADPAGRFDRWMLLNLSNDADTSFDTGIPLSVIGVQKLDVAGNKLDKVRLYFRDYNIVAAKGAPPSLVLPEDRSGKCFSCHPSGVRRLIDRRTKTTVAKPVKGEADYDLTSTAPAPADFGFKRLQELNHILDQYGLPDWQGMIAPDDHGPALGSEFGCPSCHNGTTRGVLTVSTSTTQLEQKIAVQLSMPPEAGLIALLEKSEMQPSAMTAADKATLQSAQDDRDQLTGAFEDARASTLASWLQAQSCQ